ncbi:MAG: hypothetical protein K6D56_06610 [Clostridia bacterium]|nr:hypothetical protein [Clostridia bacterium]
MTNSLDDFIKATFWYINDQCRRLSVVRKNNFVTTVEIRPHALGIGA